jgi:hypothetical protein
MARVELLPGEVPRRSTIPRYPDQESVEAAVKKTSSSSDTPMRMMATS